MFRRGRALVFVVPALALLALWLYKTQVVPRPFWAFVAGDGDVVSFFNSLVITEWHRPGSVFHPATPVQLLGAAVAVATGGLPGVERFFRVTDVIGLVSALAAMAVLAAGTLRRVRPWLGIAVVLSFFMHPSALLNMTIFASYMFHALAAWIALTVIVRAAEGDTRLRVHWVLAAGVASGFACSINIFFVPLVVAAAIAVGGAAIATPPAPTVSRGDTRLVRLAAGFVVMTTLAAVALYLKLRVPFASLWAFLGITLVVACGSLALGARLDRADDRRAVVVGRLLTLAVGALAGWMGSTFFVLDRLWARIGTVGAGYGRGATSVPLDHMIENLRYLPRLAPEWTVLLVVGIVLLAAMAASGLRRSDGRGRPVVVTALLAAVLLALMIALKQAELAVAPPGRAGLWLRYMMPTAAILTFAFAWVAAAVGASLRGTATVAVAALALMTAGGFVRAAIADAGLHRRVVDAARAEKAAVDVRIADIERALGRRPLVMFWDIARPSWALRWGDFDADSFFKGRLDVLFPFEGFFDIRYRRAYLPVGVERYDAVIGYEREIDPANVTDPAKFWAFLHDLGRVERVTGAFPEPVVVVWCPGPRGCSPS